MNRKLLGVSVLLAVTVILPTLGVGQDTTVTINPGDILVSGFAAEGADGVIRVDPVSGAQTIVSTGGFFGG